MQGLRRLRSPVLSVARGSRGSRAGSSSSHSHAAHEAGHQSAGASAYEAQTPRLFGEAPGERVTEAWEVPFYLTIGGVAAVFFAYQFRPSTNPHDWAKDEAEERFRRADAGLPVVRGVNYAGVRFLKEAGTITEEEALALEEGAVSEPKMPTFASRATLS